MARPILKFLAGVVVGLVGTTWLIVSTEPVTLDEREIAMANRMRAFLRALHERPVNENPAGLWKPLAKDGAISCRVCHGAAGDRYDRAPHDGAPPMDRDEMIALMEEWVEQLNREAGQFLGKAIVCTDCHERDPRRE